ncbi:NADH-quinone oxidoreductase subunit J [Thalassomonas sp. M1454]|uniref:NADH-quinone oxidoreductase subunit J n=1 Tax=Thalassomonas sp. M1454 TaxID=2594477 RepID=UPI00118043A0|nr:NADH-quinone oxidoreductase subunit J [Thalassomonas sp. M1454]TRX55752.1 NADH-quinone oxidoreductase subunit J [Thalassomonas sp. M1454]
MSVEVPFYFAATIAIIASLRVVTGSNAIHALLYLVVSLLAVAVCFYFIGAPFAAGLEVIVYAGAILVLFVFAVMMFDLQGDDEPKHFGREGNSAWFSAWFGPSILALLLLFELVYIIVVSDSKQLYVSNIVEAKQVGILLYGPYLLAVEIASFLLLAGLVAGYHFAKPDAGS